MSWSVNFIGKPGKVAEAVEAHAANLTGQSKLEYEAAMPHLAALVRENFARGDVLVNLSASGSGLSEAGAQVQRQLAVKIEPVYGSLLL